MKVYQLKSNVTDHSSFIQDYCSPEKSIMGLAMGWKWQEPEDYKAIRLKLRSNDAGKKNYQFDISGALDPFMILSEQATSLLGDILENRGVFLPVITESKRKSFIGYYPTNVYPKGLLDLDQSDYVEGTKGLNVRRPVLRGSNIPNDYLFCIEEDISRIFVTEKFKEVVEELGLEGFDFSREIGLS